MKASSQEMAVFLYKMAVFVYKMALFMHKMAVFLYNITALHKTGNYLNDPF